MKETIQCFTWDTSNIPRINQETVTHKLNIDMSFKLVKHKNEVCIREKSGCERRGGKA